MSNIVHCIEGLEFHADSASDAPRVLDLDVGRRVGLARPRAVRDTIKAAIRDGAFRKDEHYRELPAVAAGTKESVEYWLTLAGAVKLTTRLRTPVADAVTDDMVRVYCEAITRVRTPVALPPAPPPMAVAAVLESGPRMGDTPEGRLEVRRRCEVTAKACGRSLASVQGFVRRQGRVGSPYYIGAIHWHAWLMPMLDDLAMGRLMLPATRKVGALLFADPRQVPLFDPDVN